MTYTQAQLTVGTTKFFSKYNGYSVSKNKIWSRNTGRTSSGSMVGTIIAIKTKIEMELVPLTPKEAEILDDVVSDESRPFVSVKYTGVNGKEKTITGYFGDITFPFVGLSINNGNGLIDGVRVSVIER